MEAALKKIGEKKKILIPAIAALLAIIALAIVLIVRANAITAVSMRIFRMVGTVNLYDNGREQSMKEKMRLKDGHSLKTAEESLVMISLDEIKLFTMEESSRARVVPSHKKLEYKLEEGSLYFNVTEKLPEDENFEITTNTMICGIRGTSGFVGLDATNHETLMVTDGIVHVVATNPVTKEVTEVDVVAGEMITIYLDDEAEGDATISIDKKKFREEDLPALALDAIAKSPELMDRIFNATGFFSDKISELARLSSTPGISMYGQAVKELDRAGIDDAIPYMGRVSDSMVIAANNAVDIAQDDLALEVAILTGTKDVHDNGYDNGYRGETLATIMDSAMKCVDDSLVSAKDEGLSNEDLRTLAETLADTLDNATEKMTVAGLDSNEISSVIDAIETVIADAIENGAENGDILSAVSDASSYVKNVVTAEMIKDSNGAETVAALLGKDIVTVADNDENSATGNDASSNESGNGTTNGTGNFGNGTQGGNSGNNGTSGNDGNTTDGGNGSGDGSGNNNNGNNNGNNNNNNGDNNNNNDSNNNNGDNNNNNDNSHNNDNNGGNNNTDDNSNNNNNNDNGNNNNNGGNNNTDDNNSNNNDNNGGDNNTDNNSNNNNSTDNSNNDSNNNNEGGNSESNSTENNSTENNNNENNNTEESTPSPEMPEITGTELTMPATAPQISAEFANSDTVIVKASDTGNNTLTFSSDFSVPVNKTLVIGNDVNPEIASGTTFTVEAGAKLQNYGTITNNGQYINKGTLDNFSSNTYKNYGTFINTEGATVNNGDSDNEEYSGRFINGADAVVGNSGNFNNNGNGAIQNSGIIVGDFSEDSGTVSGNPVEANGGKIGETCYFYFRDNGTTQSGRQLYDAVVFGVGEMDRFSNAAAYGMQGTTLWEVSRPYIKNVNVKEGITKLGQFFMTSGSYLENVTLPNTMTSINYDAFYHSSLRSINIPDTVEHLCSDCFKDCPNLTSITLPDGLTDIGDGVFKGCSSLTSINLPEGINTIKASTFSGCSSLQNIVIPSTVTKIEENAFNSCSSLTSLNIPDTVTDIGEMALYGTAVTTMRIDASMVGDGAFRGNETLETLIIGKEVKTIGSYAFYELPNLKNVIIEEGSCLEAIPEGAFCKCVALESIEIPASVTKIDEYAFDRCKALKTVTFKKGGTKDLTIEKCAFNETRALETLELPPRLKFLGEESFAKSGIASLTYETVDVNTYRARELSFGKAVFEYCKNLTSVSIPANVIKLGGGTKQKDSDSGSCFFHCDKLSSVQYEEGTQLTTICRSAFNQCPMLTQLPVPNTVAEIGEYAFCKCTGLQSVTIPVNVTRIENHAFEECTNLRTVVLNDKLEYLSGFDDCGKIASITIPSSVKEIGYVAFYGTALKNVTIPSSVTAIGGSAFSNCWKLESINIPSSVKSIGTYAFCDSDKLTSITIPSSVTRIEEGTFKKCDGITSLTIPDSVTYVGEEMCKDMAYLETLVLPQNITSIPGWMCENCYRLKNINLPDGITSIGSAAFRGCSSLESIELPDTLVIADDISTNYYLTSIFNGCQSLTHIKLSAGMEIIPQYFFGGCASLQSITIPANVTKIHANAFGSCYHLDRIEFEKGSKLKEFVDDNKSEGNFAGTGSATEDNIISEVIFYGNWDEVKNNHFLTEGYDLWRAPSRNVTASETSHGNIVLSSDFEIPGYTYGYLLEPEEGYKIKEGTMSVKAGDDTVSYLNSNGTYSFTMPDSDVHISAEFEKEIYIVSKTTSEEGTITLGRTTAQIGDTVTFTVSAVETKQIDKVYVKKADGSNVEFTKKSGGNYSFTMPASSVTVSATYKLADFDIGVRYVDYTSRSYYQYPDTFYWAPMGCSCVELKDADGEVAYGAIEGETVTVILPEVADGYKVSWEVKGDNTHTSIATGETGTGSFRMPKEPVTLYVYYMPVFDVEFATDGHGSFSGVPEVEYFTPAEAFEVVLTPEENYSVYRLWFTDSRGKNDITDCLLEDGRLIFNDHGALNSNTLFEETSIYAEFVSDSAQYYAISDVAPEGDTLYGSSYYLNTDADYDEEYNCSSPVGRSVTAWLGIEDYEYQYYTLKALTVLKDDGSSETISVTDNEDGSFSFVMPECNVKLVPTIEDISRTITLNTCPAGIDSDWYYYEVMTWGGEDTGNMLSPGLIGAYDSVRMYNSDTAAKTMRVLPGTKIGIVVKYADMDIDVYDASGNKLTTTTESREDNSGKVTEIITAQVFTMPDCNVTVVPKDPPMRLYTDIYVNDGLGNEMENWSEWDAEEIGGSVTLTVGENAYNPEVGVEAGSTIYVTIVAPTGYHVPVSELHVEPYMYVEGSGIEVSVVSTTYLDGDESSGKLTEIKISFTQPSEEAWIGVGFVPNP